MDSTDLQALRRIADTMDRMPDTIRQDDQRGDGALLKQADTAGRLLAEAMDAGAFAEEHGHGHLHDLREQCTNTDKVMGYDVRRTDYASFWIVCRQSWLRTINPHHQGDMGTHTPGWQFSFSNDVRIVADAVRRQADAMAPEPVTVPMIDTTTAAARLGKAERTLRRWCEQGREPCHNARQVGGTWSIPDADIPMT